MVSLDTSPAAENCRECGFDFGLLGEVRQTTIPRDPKSSSAKPPTDPMDPLERWLTGEAIQPKHLTAWQSALIWTRQHPYLSLLSAAVMIAAVAIPTVSLLAYVRVSEALRTATVHLDAAERERLELRSAMSQKGNELENQDARWQLQMRERRELETSLHDLQTTYDQSKEQCRAAEARLQDEVRKARLSMADDFSRQARDMQQLPDVSLVLAANALSITQQEKVPPIPAALQQICDHLAPSDNLRLRGHEGPVAQLAASRDGTWVASGDHHGLVRLWNATSEDGRDTPRLLEGHWGRIKQLVFTSDNRWLVSGSADSTVHLWKLEATQSRTVPLLLRPDQGRLVSMAISDSGRWLAIAGAGHVTSEVYVKLWDLHAANVLESGVDLPAYQGQLCSLAVSRDGDRVATGNDDGIVRLWQLSHEKGAVIASDLRSHGDPVRAIRFAPDGRSLITAAGRATGKGTVRAWSLDDSDSNADAILADTSSSVELMAITSDGKWLFTANEEPALRVRDLTALKEAEADTLVDGQASPVQALALSADNHWLATAGTDNSVRLWYVGANGPAAAPVTMRIPRGLITTLAFTGQGEWLATGNDGGSIQLWNLRVDDLIRIANVRASR